MAVDPDFEQARQRLIKRLSAIVAELEQIVRDKTWWNDNRTEHPPFDVGNELVAIRIGREILTKLEAGERVPQDLYARWLETIETGNEVQSDGER